MQALLSASVTTSLAFPSRLRFPSPYRRRASSLVGTIELRGKFQKFRGILYLPIDLVLFYDP